MVIGLIAKFITKRPPVKESSGSVYNVVVIIAAHNEAQNLKARIRNIYASIYPSESIQVVVASDGSTDDTIEILKSFAADFPKLTWVDIHPKTGRANAHNRAYEIADGEILFFTDAESSFHPDFIKNIVAVFRDPHVGFASGVLKYRNIISGAVTGYIGLYWRLELWLREQETSLGLYALGTGACCAVRKGLYRRIPLTGDVDFTTPLDVIKAGYRCIHVRDAIAFDVLPNSRKQEFRARVRMTSKNLAGTLMRWGLSGFLRFPLYSLALFSHKIGRWLTPFAMLGVLFSNIFLLGENPVFIGILMGQGVFYLLALAGHFGLRIPLAGNASSFMLANIAFFIGVINALIGRVPQKYVPANNHGQSMDAVSLNHER